jgi:hypothetical protein
MNPLWAGLWKEDAGKSSIFVPSTLAIEPAGDRAYSLVETGGGRTRLVCINTGPCHHISAVLPAQSHIGRFGIEYQLQATGTELKVETWRVVPDGMRLTDTDTYVRATLGTGFAGTWRKVHSEEAPTTYRITVYHNRMTFMIPNGELYISFSLSEASTPRGAIVSRGPGRANRYKVLDPSKILEENLRHDHVFAQSIITLSPDGKTMTEDHADAGPQANPLHIVYDRK